MASNQHLVDVMVRVTVAIVSTDEDTAKDIAGCVVGTALQVSGFDEATAIVAWLVEEASE